MFSQKTVVILHCVRTPSAEDKKYSILDKDREQVTKLLKDLCEDPLPTVSQKAGAKRALQFDFKSSECMHQALEKIAVYIV